MNQILELSESKIIMINMIYKLDENTENFSEIWNV